MPSPWTALNERKLLMSIIDHKVTFKWQQIAQSMGPQFSAEACRQKYYKLRNEIGKQLDGQPSSTPSTPTKRKASDDEGDKKPTPPSKRARKPKWEPLDGIPFSNSSDGSDSIKEGDMAAKLMGMTPTANMFEQQFMHGHCFTPASSMPVTEGNVRSVNNSFMG